MAKEFGWAYVVGSQASGPKGSIQLAGDETALDHDPNLIWSDDQNALLVSGNIIAYNFEIQNQTKTVFEFEVSGSSVFGDTPDDLHQFTGSIDVSGNVTAHTFIGYGGDLEGVAINEYTNAGDNRLVTSVGLKSVHAEDNLLFDGSLLSVTGNVQAIAIEADQVSGSIGLFDMLETLDLQTSRFTDGTLTIETGTIANASHIQSSTIEGILTSPSQTNITDVGTLNTLNVANDATFNGTFYVKTTENKIGVNVSDPVATQEILSTDTQIRLSSQREIFGVQDAEYTDLHTNTEGDFTITPSNGQTNVEGNLNVSGDLIVTGSLVARVTDFSVSADTLTLGDEATDDIIINASSMTAPNGLSINNDFFINEGKIGVGDYSDGAKLEIEATENQFKVGTSTEKLSISVNNGSTTLSTQTSTLDIGNDTNILGELVVGSNGDIILDNVGQISSSVSVSSQSGYFTNITSDVIVNGNTTINDDNIETPTLDAATVNSTNLGGTLTTAAQPNVTSLGTLTSLNVASNANIGGPLAINKSTANAMVDIKDSENPQLRLTNSEFVFGVSQDQYVDLRATSAGDLSIESKSGKVIIPNLSLTNIQQGSSSNFLSLDGDGNVILSPAVQSGIEVRNRVVVSEDYTVSTTDYFIGIQAQSDLVVTLPDASTLFDGQIMVLKDESETADQHLIQVVAQPNQLIENRSSLTLASAGAAVNIYTDGQSKFFIM
jgi:hypothetical protein